MLGIKYLKLPRYRKFAYQPMYYDAEQEELNTRVKEAKKTHHGKSNTDKKIQFKQSMTSMRSRYEEAKKNDNKRKVRIILLAVGMLFVLYLFLFL